MNFLYILAAKSVFDIPWALMELGHTIHIIENLSIDPLYPEEAHNQIIVDNINKYKPDYVISYLFMPQVSDITHQFGIPYISWTYDSPLVSLFTDSLENDNNYSFIFDKAQYERLKKISHSKIFYLPMAANLSRIGSLTITDEEIGSYGCDISFIGSLYQDNAYNEVIGFLDDQTQLELKTYLLEHTRNWNSRKIWPVLSEHAFNAFKPILNETAWNQTKFSPAEYAGLLVLTRKLAEIDRITILNALAEKYDVHLYTPKASTNLVNVTVHEPVDYLTMMNKIFYSSKINMNITLPSIETGLPQRIFDICSCGGFTMTNYQEELDDLFTIGHDIEAFKSVEELLDKTNYYLHHEKERLQISLNGYKTIRDRHTYIHRMQEIIRIVNQ